MLVLSRKINQEILINGNIKVSVLKVKGNVVRIGIEAPAEVSIKRAELATQEIELPIAETTDGADEPASFTISLDPKTAQVSQETAGFQLLPLPADESLANNDAGKVAYDVQAQFPEILQRGLCCDTISSNHKSA